MNVVLEYKKFSYTPNQKSVIYIVPGQNHFIMYTIQFTTILNFYYNKHYPDLYTPKTLKICVKCAPTKLPNK